MDENKLTLADLKPGESARISQICTKGILAQRLIDMGLYPGLEVNILRCAPLGDPMEIMADGAPISLRREEARYVLIEKKS